MSHGFKAKYLTKDEIQNLIHSFDSQECKDFVKDYLIEQLDSTDSSAAIGICRLLIDVGYEQLSDKQKAVFDTTIQQHIQKCGRCDEFLWEEADYIVQNGLCTYCQSSWDKNYKEE